MIWNSMTFDDVSSCLWSLEGYQHERFRDKRVKTPLVVVSYPSPLLLSSVPSKGFAGYLNKSVRWSSKPTKKFAYDEPYVAS